MSTGNTTSAATKLERLPQVSNNPRLQIPRCRYVCLPDSVDPRLDRRGRAHADATLGYCFDQSTKGRPFTKPCATGSKASGAGGSLAMT